MRLAASYTICVPLLLTAWESPVIPLLGICKNPCCEDAPSDQQGYETSAANGEARIIVGVACIVHSIFQGSFQNTLRYED